MEVTARPATPDDLTALECLYRLLEKEMTELHPMWPIADGLPEPVEASLRAALADPDAYLYIGEIDGYPLGFALARLEALLPQADGAQIGSFRLIFTELEAREVGVGEAVRDAVMAALRERRLSRFDAHVLPGHRLAKNFFEAGGYSARHIVMFHEDDDEAGAGSGSLNARPSARLGNQNGAEG